MIIVEEKFRNIIIIKYSGNQTYHNNYLLKQTNIYNRLNKKIMKISII